MKRFTLAVLAVLAGCGGTEGGTILGAGGPPQEPPEEDVGPAPGMAVDLNALIGAPPGGFTWEIASAHGLADQAGLLLTGALLHLPDCRWTNVLGQVWPYSVTVQAVRDGVVVYSLTVSADERFLSSSVVCYVPSGETVCRDPALPLVVEAGSSIQWYSLVRATCTTAYTPALPAGACPAGAEFAFCRGG